MHEVLCRKIGFDSNFTICFCGESSLHCTYCFCDIVQTPIPDENELISAFSQDIQDEQPKNRV